MNGPSRTVRLRCPGCGSESVCGTAEMQAQLNRLGMLRRVKDPEVDIIVELFTNNVAKIRCQACRSARQTIASDKPAEEDGWPEARSCQMCREPISLERLDVFPDATLCMKCQTSEDAGTIRDEPEFCPRCGGLMTVRGSRGRGISRYVMVCTECGASP